MAVFTITNASGLVLPDVPTVSQGVSLFGATGEIVDLSIAFTGVDHVAPSDLDMLLLAPDAASNLVFWSDAGGGPGLADATITVSDGGAGVMPGNGALVSGTTYRPSNFQEAESAGDFGLSGIALDHPGAVGIATFASSFGGIAPNGAWTLFVDDDLGGLEGSLEAWSLSITTSSDDVVIDGTSGNDVLVVTATGAASGTYALNGGPAVTFSGISSLTFNGLGGDDSLVIATTGVDFVPGQGVTFNGGGNSAGGSDTLSFVGDRPTNQTYQFGANHSGVVRLGDLDPGVFAFSGVEKLDNQNVADEVTFNQAASSSDFFLEDNGVAFDSAMRMRGGDAFTQVVFQAPGQHLHVGGDTLNRLKVNLADPLGAVDVSIGTRGLAGNQFGIVEIQRLEARSVEITAFEIREAGADVAADIIADTLLVRGTTGAGNAIETMVSTLEAEGFSVAIVNGKALVIGGGSDFFDGIDVTGDVDITARGSIRLADTTSAQVVNSFGGDIRLTALGLGSDILGETDGDTIVNDAFPGGDIFLTAGRDIAFGSADGGTAYRLAGDGIHVAAGRNIRFNDVPGTGFEVIDATGDLSLTAGQDVSLVGVSALAGDGGNFDVATGVDGALTLTDAALRLSFDGERMNIRADRILLGGSASIVAPSTVIAPSTAGRDMVLGDAIVPDHILNLSQQSLDRLFVDHIGFGDENTSSVSIFSSFIGATAVRPTIDHVEVTADRIDVLTPFEYGGGDLTLRAGTSLFIGSTVLPQPLTTGGTVVQFVDAPDADPGLGGVRSGVGTVQARLRIVEGNGDADQLTGTAASETFRGMGGADTIDGGGSAADTADYSGSPEAVTVNLLTGLGSGGHAAGDRLSNILDLIGSNAAQGDRLTGNGLANRIEGLAGADTIAGGGGIDTVVYSLSPTAVNVNLGAGVGIAGHALGDVISQVENIIGGNVGTDMLTGSAGANRIDGRLGDDFLNGVGGNDTLNGGNGNDTVRGGAGVDLLFGDFGDPAEFSFAIGVDRFAFSAASEIGNVAGARDIIADFDSFDRIDFDAIDANTSVAGVQRFAWLGAEAHTGSGATLNFSQVSGKTLISGDTNADGASDFILELTGLHNLFAGSFTNATIAEVRGTGTGDLLVGAPGGKLMNGLGGGDIILAAAGADTLRGGDGADTMTGGAGADRFDFDGVAEIGMAPITRDIITDFQQGLDRIDLDDIDALTTLAGAQHFTWLGTAGHTGAGATLRFQQSGANTLIFGDVNADSAGDFTIQVNGLHNLTAADFTDATIAAIQGTNGGDVLTGAPGGKTMTGLDGDDTITGGSGADTIFGSAGADSMAGGLGSDVFRWSLATHTGLDPGARDIIADFQPGLDRIDLSPIDANSTIAGNQAFTFLGTGAHTGAGGTLRFAHSGSNTVIFADIDADGGGDFAVQLAGTIALTAADFVL